MRPTPLLLALSPLLTSAYNIVVSNDDGWADSNVRSFVNTLSTSGFSAILSAPAENQSGTGSSNKPPKKLGPDGCQYDSCRPNAPAIGYNSSDPKLNYVNSFPVTAMRYGIETLSPIFFGGEPDVAVAGPNAGSNLGVVVLISGTVGAAAEAVKRGIPGIAFSGRSGPATAWNAAKQPAHSEVYAQLATQFTSALLTSGPKPYLPENVYLNVNFPSSNSKTCSRAEDFTFVLSRIYPALPLLTPRDVVTCNNGGRLPSERSVISDEGCFVSVSVGKAGSKGDATAAEQAVVLGRLGGILECLPRGLTAVLKETSSS